MPFEVIHEKSGWFVAKQSNPKRRYSKKPFETKKEAMEQMKALYASEGREMAMKEEMKKPTTKKRVPMKSKSPAKTAEMKKKK